MNREEIDKLIEDREKLGLDSDDVIDLILGTEDPEYIKSCIKDREKLGLNSYDLKYLIKGTKDPEYIKSCIEDREKLGLNSDDVKYLILGTKDPEYIKSCIKDREKLGLNSYDVVGLIIEIEDPEYIKSCIKDREKLGLKSDDVKYLIKGREDPEYIKSCIKDREKLGLNSYEVKDLIIGTEDPEYIKSCIEDREELGLDSSTVRDLIIQTEDLEYIKSCIEDREELGLDSSIMVNIILATGDLEFIKKYAKDGINLNLSQADIDRLDMFTKEVYVDLPENMTIGIEIESEAYDESDNKEIIKRLLSEKNWESKGDGSLRNGTEVVSPILTGDSKKTSDEIREVCAVLNGVGQTISERCGGHVHIGADFLTSKQAWENLTSIWINAEKVLYTISNETGTIPREGVLRYAPLISKKIEDAINNGTINLEGEEDLNEYVSAISKIQGDRDSGINFKNVGKSGKNTIEFRLANGTINPNIWIENINLFSGIVRCAQELSIIQQKPEEQRTEAEIELLKIFEIIQTEQNEQQVAEALVKMCIPEKQRQTYMDRYNKNSEKLEEHPEIKGAIVNQISTNKIGKKVFTGKEAVVGEDYNQVANSIIQELERSENTQENNMEASR